MADIRLIDVVQLRSVFEIVREGPGMDDSAENAAPRSRDDDSLSYPPGDFHQIKLWSSEEDGETLLLVVLSIDTPELPFKLELEVGARFDVNVPEEDSDSLDGTLLWMTYPYLREMVTSLTAKSPVPPYYLPAMTMMPHPSVGDGPATSGA